MGDLPDIVDRVEIEALRGEFTDAVMMHDYDRSGSLFTQDAAVRMPAGDVALVGRDELWAGIERMQGQLEFFVPNTHPGMIQLDGDTASGQRTPEGWKFAERVYEIRYLDETPLTGSAPPPGSG